MAEDVDPLGWARAQLRNEATTNQPVAEDSLAFARRQLAGSQEPLPTAQPAQPEQQPNALSAGLRAGVHELGGLTGATAAATGKLTGLEGIEQWGSQLAQQQFARAREVGRPDLEVAPWHEGGAGWLPWAGYQAAKQVPQIAAGIGASLLVPEAAVPAAMARAGAALPEVLGGGAIGAAEGFAAKRAALEAGRGLARQAIGQEVAGLTPAVGSMYQEAMDRPGGPNKEDAVKAFGLAPIYSALDAASPSFEVSRFAKGLSGNLLKRVATGMATDAVLEMPQEGIQTAMELSFRPDLSTTEKASQIVDAALTGGAVGGVFGGVSSLRSTKNTEPALLDNQKMLDTIDNTLGPVTQNQQQVTGSVETAPEQPAAPVEPSTPPMMAQIEQEQAPVEQPAPAAEPEAEDRGAKIKASLADALGGQTARNTKFIERLGEVQSLPEAANKVRDLLAEGASSKTAFKLANALGITDLEGKDRDLNAEIEVETQKLAAAQIPQERAEITARIDQLETQRQILADADALRPAQSTQPTAEEMLPPVATTPVTPPSAETTNAIQEPSPEGVYVQPAPETGRPVGEGNAQGGEITGARVGEAPTTEVQGEVTAAPTEEVTPPPAPAPEPAPTPVSPAAQTFMQQQGIKQLSPEERAAARARQQAQEQAYLAKRQTQIQKAYAQNARRGGTTAAPVAPKGMTAQEFLERRNRERPAMGLPETESPLDRDVASLVENNASGKQVLDFLGQHGPTEFDRLYARHLSRLGVAPSVQFEDVNNPNLDIDREAVQGEKIYGSYNVEQNRVNLYERANAAQIMMHEATHAATDRAIRTNSPSAQKLTELFNEFKARPERYQGESPAYKHESEFISEAFSNPDFREFLKTQKVGPKNLWEKFKDAIFKLLRFPQRARTVFDQVMEIGEPLFRENQQTTMEDVYRAMGEQPLTESPMSVDKSLKGAVTTLDQAVEKLNRVSTLETAARRATLGWNSVTHILSRWGDKFTSHGTNWLQQYVDAQKERSSVAARFSQLFKRPYDDFNALLAKVPAEAESLVKIMRLTEFNMDVRKTFAEHTWLKDERNVEQLKDLFNRGRQMWNRLSPEARDIYERMEALNNIDRYAELSMGLYNVIKADPILLKNVSGGDVNPIDQFVTRAALHDDPRKARAYWKTTLEAQLKAIQPVVEQQRKILKSWKKEGAAKVTVEERKTAEAIFGALNKFATGAKVTMDAMQQSPNFHLGRFGDHMVTFSAKNVKGKADQAALEHIAMALDQIGVEAQISTESEKATIFIRTETEEQAERIRQLALDMQKRGWLDPEVKPKAGLRSDNKFATGISPQWLEQFVTAISETSGLQVDDSMTPEEQAEVIRNREKLKSRARELYLNMLPDNSLAKVLTHRKAVLGYSPDMIRSFAFRHQIATNTIANLATAPRVAESLREMRMITDESKTGPIHDTIQLQNVLSELTQREVERPIRPQHTIWDTLRAFNHAYFLGGSPSYVLVNMTQPGVLLWPELSKKHGFVKSAMAIANATPTAFKVMAAVMSTGRSADSIITEKALEASGVDADTAEFIMRVANTGGLDLGGASREIGRVVEGEVDSKTDQALRWAAAAGYYSETLTRLSAALAARDLYQNKADTKGMLAYVSKTIDESMLNYSTWNTARQMGKMGVAGEYTPVMFSFMTYQAQVLEKMYRELHDAFGGSKESQKFLLAHAGAVTVLAGSLGLPFASVAARVFDGLKDSFGGDDDEPSDIESSWRNFLAEIFGKEMGEVLARGVPRALGFDISSRAGEADLMPFSRFLTDRREWRDAAQDMALRTLGSPVSMLMNLLEGGAEFARGNAIEGLQKMVPNALKGPIAAYRMTEEGRYVDSKGRELPLTPGARDILMQAMGFTPQEKAEYQEASMAQTVRRGILTREAATLRDQLADAVINNSADRAELMQRARAHDRAHPDQQIIKTIPSIIRRRKQGLATARATGLPVGVKPQDVGARGLTSYMNVDMQ